jgi:multidrug efflux system outer membrane protein
MKKILPLFIFGMVLYLSGCKLGPDFVKPEYSGPATFQYDSLANDTIVNLRWWELFQDPVLDTLITKALESNKNVMIAAARVESARASLGYTKAGQWPSFSFSAGASRGNSLGTVQFNKTSNSFYGFAQMNWEIGFWGKYRRLNEAARAEFLASEYALRTVQIGLISEVAAAYFTLLDNEMKLEISKKTLAARDSSLLIIKARYKYGIVPEIDLNQAQIQRAISAVAIPIYERNIAYSKNALATLLGQYSAEIPDSASLFDEIAPINVPAGLPSQLLQRRPDVRQAEELYAAQNARIGAAEAMRWPSLNLTGLLGIASTSLTSLTASGLGWSAGASLLGPIFEFGKNKRRVEIEKAKTVAALHQYENVTLQAFKEVEDALVSVHTLRQEFKAQQQRSDAAINAEILSYERYDKGQTSYLEVLESQRQSFEAQLARSQTKAALLNAYVALYKALGGGWLSPKEEQAYRNALQTADTTQKSK